MLVYRVENDEGYGPYNGGYVDDIHHPHWYNAPYWDRDTIKWDRDNKRELRFGMSCPVKLRTIFIRKTRATVLVSTYRVPDEHCRVVYDDHGGSEQVLFDKRYATLVRRKEFVRFYGHKYQDSPEILLQTA